MVINERHNMQAVRMTITLGRTGETFTFDRPKRPRYWKSWVMDQLPYGTDFYGSQFSIERKGQ